MFDAKTRVLTCASAAFDPFGQNWQLQYISDLGRQTVSRLVHRRCGVTRLCALPNGSIINTGTFCFEVLTKTLSRFLIAIVFVALHLAPSGKSSQRWVLSPMSKFGFSNNFAKVIALVVATLSNVCHVCLSSVIAVKWKLSYVRFRSGLL